MTFCVISLHEFEVLLVINTAKKICCFKNMDP